MMILATTGGFSPDINTMGAADRHSGLPGMANVLIFSDANVQGPGARASQADIARLIEFKKSIYAV